MVFVIESHVREGHEGKIFLTGGERCEYTYKGEPYHCNDHTNISFPGKEHHRRWSTDAMLVHQYLQASFNAGNEDFETCVPEKCIDAL
jgi:hypothetical protein